MRKDTAWVAVVCLFLGGIIGYLLGAREATKSNDFSQSTSSAPPSNGSSTTTSELPEGHPQITTAAEFETLRKATEAAPQNAELLNNLANKYYDAGRYTEAIPLYERVLALVPQNVGVITDLGTAYFYSGDPDKAILQYQRSLALDPRHIQTLHNLVIVNVQGKRDLAAARAALDRLKEVDPNNASLASLTAMVERPDSNAPSRQSSNPRQRIF